MSKKQQFSPEDYREPEGWSDEAQEQAQNFVSSDAEALRLWDESAKKAARDYSEEISRLWGTPDSGTGKQ